MTDILEIDGEPQFDDRIIKIETHTYNPYANTTFGNSDEVRIPIQHQDLYTLPCESYLNIEGKLTIPDVEPPLQPAPELCNNCVAFMFDELRYELDGVEIDRSRNVGITSTLKNYVSLTTDESHSLKNAGWDVTANNGSGYFNFSVPLKYLLGFCEDYKQIVINARHELVLIRARTDNNCIIGNPEANPKLEIYKIQWKMPHVMLNDVAKLSLLKALNSEKYFSMSFRSWELYELPLLPQTTKHSWTLKASNQMEKPRYLVHAFQTERKNNMMRNTSHFDACKFTNAKLFLNALSYPYDDINADHDKNKIAVLYNMYMEFYKNYYGREHGVPFLNIADFKKYAPITVIDCSRQNESVKNSTVDVRLEFECKEDVPNNTTAYALIIHDRVVEYNPFSNVVRKILS